MTRTSIREVARRAGVSVGTVSNVLNRPDLVAEATRARVRSAIEELGFVRNESARQLRQGHSRTLGVVVEDVANPYFTDVAKGAEAAMNADGFDAMLCSSDGLPGKEQRCLDFLEEQRVSGVLITPVDLRADRIARLRDRGMSVVVLDRRDRAADACSARVDHAAGGEIAVHHLLARGHRRLALITAESEPEPCRERRAGAERALRQVPSASMVTLYQSALTATAGRDAARRLLQLTPPPSAAFCANDLLAIGVVNELTRLGVKVPEELAVIGYDDIELAATAAIPLTTVRQPRHALGWAAAEMAIAETADGPDHDHQHMVLTPDLVVRESA
ncbi:MAG TPA: LacI family DNA-binding transcriptional regulator [Streptosporangiaceae bacterium]